jgi:hypothetical protein
MCWRLYVVLSLTLGEIMEAELKKKWLDALRSGRYRQGLNELRTKDDRYCCLGVLCDISNAGRWRKFSDSVWSYRTDKGEKTYVLPDGVDQDVYLKQTPLVNMNDQGQSFTTIADWIEREF